MYAIRSYYDTLEKELDENDNEVRNEEVRFESNGLNLNGTIWYANNNDNKALIIVTSSGNSDRT